VAIKTNSIQAVGRFSPRLNLFRRFETSIKFVFFICAFLSVFITLGITFVLLKETIAFFQRPEITLREFFFTTDWSPTFDNPKFGILPLVNGTLIITIGSLFIATPIGLLTAVFLSQYASTKARNIIKPVLELLAGIPTVVYGYLGLFYVTPGLQVFFPSVEVFNAASGCIVVAIMVLPLITTLCDDAFSAVPRTMAEGALAVGSTKFEVIKNILFRAALSGIAASIILAMSRAIGETMAVTLAAGQNPKMTLNPAESIQTMTAYIVQISKGDTPVGSTSYLTLYAVGFVLFAITMTLNIIAKRLVKRFRIISI